MKSRNPEYLTYVKEKMAKNAFMHFIGMEMTSIGEGEMKAKLVFKPEHEQQNGYLHGGLSATLCDVVSGFASYSLVEQGQQVFTVEAKTSFFNPGKGKEFIIEGMVIKAGRRFHFCEAEVYYLEGEKHITVVRSTTTMAVI